MMVGVRRLTGVCVFRCCISHTLLQAKSRQASAAFRGKAGDAQYQDPEYDQSDEDSS